MRNCKQCNENIEHMNKNTIFCSGKCRKKYDYYNKEGEKEKQFNKVYKKRMNEAYEKELKQVELIKYLKRNLGI